MNLKLFMKEFYYRKFIFVKTAGLRIYVILSVLIVVALILTNSKNIIIISFFLFLFSFSFFIKKRHAGAISYSAVLYGRRILDKDKDYKWILVKSRNLDLLNYIEIKVNQNILICGTSGQGKSRLMRYLLYLSTDKKVIFSYKDDDDYLKMGYNIFNIKYEMPDPFEDNESFINSFLITFPIQNMGIISQYIPIFLREIGKISSDWDDFLSNLNLKLKSSKDQIQRSAYLFIIEHSKPLIGSNYKNNIKFDEESIVLDFSELNESSKTFYSELVLRLLWKKLTKEQKKIIICIDEAHRLLQGFEKYHSIYIEMSREIRAFGKLWTSTQNYSDIPSYVRNQFATQFLFNTSIKEDLDQLSTIDAKLRWAVVNMPEHCFTDTRYPWIFKVVPEFMIYWYPLDIEKKENILKTVNYNNEVIKILRDNVFSLSKIIEIISKNYNIDENTVKINVKNSINNLIAKKEINKVFYDSNYLYFGKTLDSKNLSLFHQFLQNKIIDVLSQFNIKMHTAKKGQNLPDIITDKYNIEIESGLKHDLFDLKERIKKSNKENIIIIPNKILSKKYASIKNVEIFELEDFKTFLENNYNK